MTYSIHSSSAVHHHPSATFSGEKCSIMNSTVSLKRKSLSPLCSEPSPKRVTLNSPPPSSSTTTTTVAIAATEDGPSISPSPAFSPLSKRVSEISTFSTTANAATIAATEDGPVISQITSLSPAFSPFSKRVSEKSPFSTTNAAAAANTTAAPSLPFSRFTKIQPNNNNTLRRTLSEPPVFDSFASFCCYMKYSESPDNTENNSISVKLPLRRSISDHIAADIILVPARAAATPSLASETTKRKVPEQFTNEEDDKENKSSHFEKS